MAHTWAAEVASMLCSGRQIMMSYHGVRIQAAPQHAATTFYTQLHGLSPAGYGFLKHSGRRWQAR